MSIIYQIGNLTVMSDHFDDISDSVLKDFTQIHTTLQKEKWDHLTNTNDNSEETSLKNWTSIVSGNQNTERNLIHSQFNFPNL